MATLNKFNQFSEDLSRGVHNFKSGGASYAVVLSNTAPTAANAVYADVSGGEIANGGGYTTGGLSTTMTDSTSGGTELIKASNVTLTATATVGPFRYAIVYNTSQTSPAKPLVGWYDYGSAVTLNSGDSFTITFDQTNGFLTVA